MKLTQLLATTFSFLFAFGLSLGAIQSTALAAPASSPFVADLLSADDRPGEAVTSPFRQAAIGVVNYLLTFLGLLAVGMIVYGGVMMVVAGDDKGWDKAKNIIIYSGVGIVVVLLSFAIVRVFVDVKTTVA